MLGGGLEGREERGRVGKRRRARVENGGEVVFFTITIPTVLPLQPARWRSIETEGRGGGEGKEGGRGKGRTSVKRKRESSAGE